VTKWSSFQGYGFNLHAEKNIPGQYIGTVDANSPAEAAGLKQKDKIIEVNGVNISQENHKQVVQRIKTNPDETRLLVVDPQTEQWHKERNIVITSQLSYVRYISSDPDYIDTRMQQVPEEAGRDSPDSVESIEETPNHKREDSHATVEREDSMLSDRTVSNRSSVSSGQGANSVYSESPRSTPSPVEQSKTEVSRKPSALRQDGLDLPLTAKEMRDRIIIQEEEGPPARGPHGLQEEV